VADPLIFSEREIEFLKELARNRVEFMIVGLAAAALQGAPVVTQDIDLWFRDLSDPGIQRALKSVRGAYVAPTMGNPPTFAGRGVELFDIVVHMHGLGAFDAEREHAIKVPLGRIKVLVLDLERIIASKKAAGRQKDRLVLGVLSDALKTIRDRGRVE
jgi:hypothetical protein